MSSRSYIVASVRHSSPVRVDLTTVQPKLSNSRVIAAQSRAAMRSCIEGVVEVTRPSFPAPRAPACDPRPNDSQRGLHCCERLDGKEWRLQLCSHRRPARRPAPTWETQFALLFRNS